MNELRSHTGRKSRKRRPSLKRERALEKALRDLVRAVETPDADSLRELIAAHDVLDSLSDETRVGEKP